jgi:dihydroflavonol-4-reductase
MPEPQDQLLRRTLVTGATGLLGSNIVVALLDRGAEDVVALVRDPDKAAEQLPGDSRVRVVRGDVNDVDGFRHELAGRNTVFHTAAYFREYYEPGPDQDLLYRTNVDAVGRLLEAADSAGVATVVHTSSVATLGPAAGGTADEDTPPAPNWTANAYRASKVRSERLVQRFLGQSELRVPTVLPGWMWGPGDAAPTSAGKLFLAVARQELRAVPRVGNYVVDARDVADACISAALVGKSGRRYCVGGRYASLPDVCASIAHLTGVPPVKVVPARAALLFATLLETGARLRGRVPVASRAGVRALLDGGRAISSERAERELGVTFRPLAQTLADQADWHRERGLLGSPGRRPPLGAQRDAS